MMSGRRGTQRAVTEAEMPHAWRADNPVAASSLARLAVPFWLGLARVCRVL